MNNSFDMIRSNDIAVYADQKPKKNYLALLNGTATNELSKVNVKKNPVKMNGITNTGTIKQGNLTVFIDKCDKVTGGLRPSTSKLLDICTIQLNKQNNYKDTENLNRIVSFSIEDYLVLCGKNVNDSSKKDARKKITEDLDTLYKISLEWTENSGKNSKNFAKTRICEGVGIKNGKVELKFTEDMARYLNTSYIMQVSPELLKIDERNGNAYALGRKLLLHYGMDNNIAKGTRNIISVKSCLEFCPDIASIDDVMSKGRQVDQRIKMPLEKALNSLPFVDWEYCNSKGKPLTDEQLFSTDYKTFVDTFIHFEILDAPDNTERIKRKATKKKKPTKKPQKKKSE